MNNIEYRLVAVKDHHQALFSSLYGDRQSMRYIGDPLDYEQTLRHFRTVLRVSQQAEQRSLYRVIEVTSEQDRIQSAGFVRLKKTKQSHKAVIGVMLRREFEGRGLAYQAQKSLMAEAQQSGYCQSFIAYCHIDNKRANRLYQRLGFHKAQQLIYNQKLTNEWQLRINEGQKR